LLNFGWCSLLWYVFSNFYFYFCWDFVRKFIDFLLLSVFFLVVCSFFALYFFHLLSFFLTFDLTFWGKHKGVVKILEMSEERVLFLFIESVYISWNWWEYWSYGDLLYYFFEVCKCTELEWPCWWWNYHENLSNHCECGKSIYINRKWNKIFSKEVFSNTNQRN
jgi:hypothetical protein